MSFNKTNFTELDSSLCIVLIVFKKFLRKFIKNIEVKFININFKKLSFFFVL